MKKRPVAVTARVHPSMNKKLESDAETKGISKADVVRNILDEHYEQEVLLRKISTMEERIISQTLKIVSLSLGLTPDETEALKNNL